MGQKTNPISLRLQKTNKFYSSNWYSKMFYSDIFKEEISLQEYFNNIYTLLHGSRPLYFFNIHKKQKECYLFFSGEEERKNFTKFFRIKKKKLFLLNGGAASHQKKNQKAGRRKGTSGGPKNNRGLRKDARSANLLREASQKSSSSVIQVKQYGSGTLSLPRAFPKSFTYGQRCEKTRHTEKIYRTSGNFSSPLIFLHGRYECGPHSKAHRLQTVHTFFGATSNCTGMETQRAIPTEKKIIGKSAFRKKLPEMYIKQPEGAPLSFPESRYLPLMDLGFGYGKK